MYADEAYSADGGRVSPLNESAPLHGQPNKSLPSEPLSREQKIFEVQRRFDEKMGKPAAEERQALVAKQMEECKAKQDLIDKGLARDLQHHSLATWLFVSFATVVVFAWTVTCVLCYRPIGASSYYDQAGYTTKAQWERSDAWRTAASVATAIIGSVGIPVTSAICAKAAAVHCQRKSDDEKPSLTLRQTLALADKGWTDLAVMRNVLTPKTSRRTRSPLLMVSACLVGLALLIPALQSGYVHTVHIKVLSFDDSNSKSLGPQVTPGYLATLPQSSIIDSITSTLIDGRLSDKQVFLWSGDSLDVTSVADNLPSDDMLAPNELSEKVFTATYPVGTDTGVIRQLALRLNSSINCETVAESEFPSSCPGNRPLHQNYTNILDDSDSDPFNGDSTKFRTRICAPGDYTASPWQGVGNRQDIFEEFWIDTQYTPLSSTDGSNFTQHCHGNSSIGYFELPNYWNGHVTGKLFDEFPAETAHNVSYYNLDNLEPDMGLPYDPVPKLPGPFMTAVLAVFGNNTFFDIAASHSNFSSNDTLLCQQLRRPFTSMYGDNGTISSWWNESQPTLDCATEDDGTDSETFLEALLEWLPNFSDSNKATAALTLATYNSNNAILNNLQGDSNFRGNGFPTYTDPGSDMEKYAMSLPAMIVITILIATQLLGLGLLARYASHHHTWTESLDSFALLRLGAAMAGDVPIVSALQAKEASMLDQKAGWIGDGGGEEGKKIRSLEMGGPQGVRRGALYRLIPQGEHDIDQDC